MSEQENAIIEEEKQAGVLGSLEKNNHYEVSIRWKDGVETISHFPVRGFEVVNPATRERLGFIKGDRAVDILKEHAAEYEHGPFPWKDFL